MFTIKYDTKSIQQTVCSNKCCLKYYAGVLNKNKAIAKKCARMVGKRSMGEVSFEQDLLSKYSGNVEYEADTFNFHVKEVRKYTPDWTIHLPDGRQMYIEYKGVLDVATRKKMLLIKEQYPDIDIRFVFQRGANFIRKGSKTTYMMWAKQHGFPCADGSIPKSWLKK